MREPVIVVGAGFGGLSAAVELARRGESVVVYEREPVVGGKARSVEVGGVAIDVGPTVLTMRWVFDEMFRGCGRSLDDAVDLAPLPVVARHHFVDGSVLDLFTDVDATAAAIEAFAGAGEATAYRRFAKYGGEIARIVEEPFLRSERPSVGSLVVGTSRIGWSALAKIDAHRSMWRAICSFFRDPRLRALFARYATYVGSSPFETPATLNLVAHVEREGVATVAGGISRLALAIAELARSLGVRIVTEAAVREVVVEAGRATGVIVEREGQREAVAARAVVLNADVATIAAGAFGARAASVVQSPKRNRRSLSALTWAMTTKVTGFDLAHHSVFFSDDYEAEHRALFEERALPDHPTIYVCAADRAPGATPERSGGRGAGAERLFIIANAPARFDGTSLSNKEIERCERTILARLSKAGLVLAPTATVVSTPTTFERMAPHTGGAIYGDACHGALAPLSRQSARTKLAGLYLAGGSIHPGPGVPMAALSGRSAATSLVEDLASTRTSPRAATGGFTSM